jgi:glycosyltransferase involved in cell wall biosynthesis
MENGKSQMSSLKGIHFGSYWMGANDIVCLMASDLKNLCDSTIVDTGIYSGNKEQWYSDDYSYSFKRPIRWLNEQKVLELIKRQQPDFVIVNSGGMSLMPSTINFLKDKGVVTVGISLSDPDVFPENGKMYSRYYDLFYTNSQYALSNLYSRKTNVKLLPFAASPKLHRPLDVNKIYDIVVVGHARPERIKIIKRLKKYFNVGLFGNGWGSEYKSVHGEDHVRAINSGKLYLSFSETAAGYKNVKIGIFEAIACKTCVVTQIFNEMESYFKYGIDILGYSNDDILVDLVNNYINNDKLRDWIINNSYKKLLREHTWIKRWETVLDNIRKCKLG